MGKSSGTSTTKPVKGSYTPEEQESAKSIFNYTQPIATGSLVNQDSNPYMQNWIKTLTAAKDQELAKSQNATMQRFRGAGQNFSSAAAGAVQNAANQVNAPFLAGVADKILGQYNTEQSRALATAAGLLTAMNEQAKTRAGLSGSTTVNTQSPWGK